MRVGFWIVVEIWSFGVGFLEWGVDLGSGSFPEVWTS
jgi:hypothetical protein